jgi:von Willebrand factor type A domain
MSFSRRTLVLILGYLCVRPLCAQQPSCEQRTIPVSISTMDSKPLRPLSSADFKGTYQKKPVRITSVTASQGPTRVVVLLDASGSVQGQKSVWNFAVGVGEDLVTGLPPTTEIGLAFFSTTSVRVATPTKEREKLKAELEALRTNPKALPPKPRRTALWDAVIDSFYMFDHPSVGDAIYVITDGLDNSSSNSSKDAAQTLGAVGVRLFALVMQGTTRPSPRPEELSSSRDFLQTVENTGGIFVIYRAEYSGLIPFFPEPDLFDKSGKPTTLGMLMAPQARQMLIFYRLDIDLPEAVDKPRELKLDLMGFDKSQREAMVLTYPHILQPCR